MCTTAKFAKEVTDAQLGMITHFIQRTASVEFEAGTGLRVSFAMLSHVMDI